MSNLGYQNHAMSVDNIDLQIVAKDASLLKGRDGTTNYLTTNTRRRRPRREPRRHLHRARARASTSCTTATTPTSTTAAGPGYGGMMTKILVGAAGTYPPQTVANA